MEIIEKGDLFICNKDILNDSNICLYSKDYIYLSELDDCITDNIHNKEHVWVTDDNDVSVYDYFTYIGNVYESGKNEVLKKLINTEGTYHVTLFIDIILKLLETYKIKNHDYGNSFEQSLNEFGLVASIVRIGDKMNRIKSLTKKEALVKDESIKDTLLDMANYCIMTAMWLNSKNDKQHE